MAFWKDEPRAVEQQDKARARERAWQRVRSAVLQRDKYRCRACGSTSHVDVHHKKLRSAGGENSTRNCLVLCRICHQRVHAYRLFIEGDDANGRLRFEGAKVKA